jgi:hypothetical protein
MTAGSRMAMWIGEATGIDDGGSNGPAPKPVEPGRGQIGGHFTQFLVKPQVLSLLRCHPCEVINFTDLVLSPFACVAGSLFHAGHTLFP